MKAALQFLTILPVRASSSQPGASAVWFPFVGCLLGVAAAALLHLPLGSILALLLLTVVTGALHEDGLADVCDAVRAYRSREKMTEILHDSRIGAHGAVAIVFSLLIRWQALAHFRIDFNVWIFDNLTTSAWLLVPAALGIARGLMVLLAAWTPAVGSGLGRDFRDSLPRSAAWLTAVQITILCFAGGWRAALILIPLQLVILAGTRRWFMARLGGVTGDCLGFTCQLAEAAALVVFAWA